MVTETDLVVKHAHVHMPTYFGILGTVIPIERRGTDEEIRRVLAITAGDLMEQNIATVLADASVEDVATLMVDEGANPVPVLDGGAVVGIVSRRELVRLLLLEEESSEPSSAV
jgi:CBS domain-containing protein